MSFKDCSQPCAVIIIIIFILIAVKHEFYENTHWYEFIKIILAIILIIFCAYIYFIFIIKCYENYNKNRIVPEENDIEKNNVEVTIPPNEINSSSSSSSSQ
jgi:hypothetical protein